MVASETECLGLVSTFCGTILESGLGAEGGAGPGKDQREERQTHVWHHIDCVIENPLYFAIWYLKLLMTQICIPCTLILIALFTLSMCCLNCPREEPALEEIEEILSAWQPSSGYSFTNWPHWTRQVSLTVLKYQRMLIHNCVLWKCCLDLKFG